MASGTARQFGWDGGQDPFNDLINQDAPGRSGSASAPGEARMAPRGNLEQVRNHKLLIELANTVKMDISPVS